MERLAARPREVYRLQEKEGFDFSHPVMGRSRLYLRPEEENIYTLQVTAADWVDSVDTW